MTLSILMPRTPQESRECCGMGENIRAGGSNMTLSIHGRLFAVVRTFRATGLGGDPGICNL